MSRHRLPRQARWVRADICKHGSPVIVLIDRDGNDFAEAHIEPENVEEFIAQLRSAVAEAAARKRPPLSAREGAHLSGGEPGVRRT